MRYATLTLTWTDCQLHPLEDKFARDDSVIVEAIEYVSPGPKGRYVELLELRGDIERAEELLDDSPDALEYDITGTEGRGVAYIQCRTAGLVNDLLNLLHDHEIVVDWPMYSFDDESRGVKVTVVGTSSAIQDAVADLPTAVDFTLERMGEYEPDTGKLSGLLTDRQLEIFDLAVREGYYEIPRQTTHQDLATKLDVSTGTVSEHLQRIESKIVTATVDPI
ncbi:DNA-binding protein [Halogeometricum borinquense]|uniref:DNA-binding protein n=1 Tax=Halogeometricum borinquense TaxID=60847 RepID=A0A6C0UGT4_9EURY|nr:helix-turn-helix domain-containing protein [Halogeometricum borinquense]QIB74440.1 DNA-binding protein [Halogeometricum borinquense]